MKKSRAVVTLLVTIAITAILLFTSAVGWGADGAGSAKDIKLGLDLAGGVSITYQAVGDEEPSAEDMADTVYKLQKRVEGYSTESEVYQEGSDRINIEIPGVSDANAILAELGKPGSLQFTTSDGTVVLEGTDVADAQAGSYADQMTQNREYVVELTLTDEGAKKFATATENRSPLSMTVRLSVHRKSTRQLPMADARSPEILLTKKPISWLPPSVSVPFPWNCRNFVLMW